MLNYATSKVWDGRQYIELQFFFPCVLMEDSLWVLYRGNPFWYFFFIGTANTLLYAYRLQGGKKKISIT